MIASVLIAIVGVAVFLAVQPKTQYPQYIPAQIGLKPGCNQPIHTHDDTGTLHVEPDTNENFILGDFFLIWGKTFNSSGFFPYNTQNLPSNLSHCVTGTLAYHTHPTLQIIYNTKAPNRTITMTVNGSPDQSLQNLVLIRDPALTQTIVITYGPGVPANFG